MAMPPAAETTAQLPLRAHEVAIQCTGSLLQDNRRRLVSDPPVALLQALLVALRLWWCLPASVVEACPLLPDKTPAPPKQLPQGEGIRGAC